MAFDLQEQEQIDDIKAFWRQWGRWICTGVVVAAVAYLGYKCWGYYQRHVATEAAVLYAPVDEAVRSNDTGKLVASAKALQDAYPSSGYAARASLLAARVAFDHGDVKTAEQALGWVTANAKEAALVAVARLRLASLKLDANQADAALAELAKPVDVAFAAQQLELKGDALSVKGDRKGAHAAYLESLAKMSPEAPRAELVQVKIDSLGG